MTDPAPNSPEDVGYAPRAPRPPPPRPAIEGVRFVDGRWEATVRRVSGKRVWLFANSERDVRALALAEVNR